ncbi:MAG TPA: hypothetical protein VFV70_13330, partial [Hyphomonadaceae bacterium]|nr:hypothetical protein [Hyphomonadaceae bacterium]
MRRMCLAGALPALVCLAALAAVCCSPVLAQEETAPPAAETSVATEAAPAAEALAVESTEAAPAAAEGATEETKAEDAPAEEVAEDVYGLDNMMLFLAAVLVIFMQPGFALVETGLNASKNAVNIMFKNFMDLAVGVTLFYIVGYGLMFPIESILFKIGESKIMGFNGFGITASPLANLSPQVFFLFQVAFAATAATIVSGAVAGRIKFASYLIYSAVITGLIYPVSGMW